MRYLVDLLEVNIINMIAMGGGWWVVDSQQSTKSV
jgi:hypothetical protein